MSFIERTQEIDMVGRLKNIHRILLILYLASGHRTSFETDMGNESPKRNKNNISESTLAVNTFT
jgi:hypothetical protein